MPGAATASDLRLFVPITKLHVEKRLVFGVATAEQPDLSGEVCDYASTRPNYEKWSAEVQKASGGKSQGTLRSMHGKVAAGKITDIAFNDEGKRIEICAKVVDDNEWNKVLEGVYTGFSQGGRYAKRWTDEATGLTHYTADPTEVSLVDMPCLPTATFDVIKADGVVEKRAFATVIEEPTHEAIQAEAEKLAASAARKGATWREFAEEATTHLFKAAMSDALAKLAPEGEKLLEKKDFSTKERAKLADAGAAESDGSYPITSAKDVENAVKDYGRSGGSEKDKAHIIAEAKRVGAEDSLPDDWRPKKAEKRFEPANKWDCGCADHTHGLKHEAVACMKKRAAEAAAAAAEATATVTKGTEAALAKIEAELGIEKAKKAEPEPGAGDVAAAHDEAAEAHTGAAELHEAMAGADDTSADDTEAHLEAASAHRRAAKAHTRASFQHASGDAGAGDATKKAGALTRAAAGKSDAIFVAKGAALEDLAKGAALEDLAKAGHDVSGEARDDKGEWTAAAEAAHAKLAAHSVLHALGSAGVALGAGEVAARAGGAIGAKVGHFAGKALALAATRHAAAGEGGAAVGSKIGHVVGSLAGRMYGEARAWGALAGKAAGDELGKATADPDADGDDDLSGADPDADHASAAAQHRSMASAHTEIAASPGAPAVDAQRHLQAANANLAAAQKHDEAIGGEASHSELAQHFTNTAINSSMDALGVTKAASGGLAKEFNADEARADNGEWTVGGVASAAARAALGAGAGALTGGPSGAVAGGIGGAMSDSYLGAAAGGLAGGAAGHLIGRGAALASRFAMRSAAVRGVVGAIARRFGNTAARVAASGAEPSAAEVNAATAAAQRAGGLAGKAGAKAKGAKAAASAKTATKSPRPRAVKVGKLAKGLYTVGALAETIDRLASIQNSMTWEAESERDDSPLPAALKTVIESLSDILVRAAQEETSELFKPDGGGADCGAAVMAMAAGMSEGQIGALIKISKDEPELAKLGSALEETQGEAVNRTIERFVTEAQTLVKIGARNSKADASRLQQAHDLLAELGAKCDDGNGNTDEDETEKLKATNAGLVKAMGEMNSRMEAVLARVEDLSKRAAPAKAVLRAVDKEMDDPSASLTAKPTPESVAKAIEALPEDTRRMVLMKMSLSNPVKAIA